MEVPEEGGRPRERPMVTVSCSLGNPGVGEGGFFYLFFYFLGFLSEEDDVATSETFDPTVKNFFQGLRAKGHLAVSLTHCDTPFPSLLIKF